MCKKRENIFPCSPETLVLSVINNYDAAIKIIIIPAIKRKKITSSKAMTMVMGQKNGQQLNSFESLI